MPSRRIFGARKRRRPGPLLRARHIAGLLSASAAAVILAAPLVGSAAAAAAPRSGRIRIEYAAPKNPAYADIARRLKQAGVLEYAQRVLGSIRLPRPLTLKLSDCGGVSNAWFNGGEVRVCYEYVADIDKDAAQGDLPIGISRRDTIVGPLLDVFLHEAGHAVFDYLDVPIFGREEDAADQFSTIVMLRFDKEHARRLILGSAYQYRSAVQEPKVALNLTKFADEHGLPAQRFFNVLCAAYGSDPKLFGDLVSKNYLPPVRAAGCADEYRQGEKAFRKLILPHVDKAAAKRERRRLRAGVPPL